MECYAIGIDLGGTSVKYAVVASSGKMPFSGQLPAFAQESAEAVLGQVLKGVEACRGYAVSEGLMLAGVGVGTPGVVSADGRTVLGGAENIAGWENIPLAGRVEEAEGLKTLAGNDANMMALGETLFGAAKGATDVVFVTVGTGIGCGALIDGTPLSGLPQPRHGDGSHHRQMRRRGVRLRRGGVPGALRLDLGARPKVLRVERQRPGCRSGRQGRGFLLQGGQSGCRAGHGGALELPRTRHRFDDQPLRPAARGGRGRHLRSRGFLPRKIARRGPGGR